MQWQPSRLALALWRRARAWSPDPVIKDIKSQRVYGYLTDPDFIVFQWLIPQSGVVIDVGSNRGHCIVSVLEHCSDLQVVAFEPNPALQKPLAYLERLYGDRLQVFDYGLGDRERDDQLLIPVAESGAISSNATARPDEFDKGYVRTRLEEETGSQFADIRLEKQPIKIKTLDQFEIAPIAIKIDVEGLEKQVIHGGLETLAKHHPLLLIEMNNHLEFWPLLEELGYQMYRVDHTAGRLVNIPPTETWLNMVCLHPDRKLIPPDRIAV